jgi:predicted protein tyrosine phosphatase
VRAETERLNVLFVCSRNQWRSPTAEQMFRRDARLAVRSAGTASSARHVVSAADIAWADAIVVMESEHKRRLRASFTRLLDHKPIHVLEIPDEYNYMDPELVALLEELVPAALGLP